MIVESKIYVFHRRFIEERERELVLLHISTTHTHCWYEMRNNMNEQIQW